MQARPPPQVYQYSEVQTSHDSDGRVEGMYRLALFVASQRSQLRHRLVLECLEEDQTREVRGRRMYTICKI